jgi:hypothetical protein
MACIKTAILDPPPSDTDAMNGLINIRNMSRNILEYALCERLANIKAAISDLTAVKEKKHASAASEVARVNAAKREEKKTRRLTIRKATSVASVIPVASVDSVTSATTATVCPPTLSSQDADANSPPRKRMRADGDDGD